MFGSQSNNSTEYNNIINNNVEKIYRINDKEFTSNVYTFELLYNLEIIINNEKIKITTHDIEISKYSNNVND